MTSLTNTKKRTLSEALKKKVVILQNFKCANFPNSNLKSINNYKCPLYVINNGLFDESGWEIDHIVEVSIGGSDEISNLQALCSSCHKVKTKNFTIGSQQSINKSIDKRKKTKDILVCEDKKDITKNIQVDSNNVIIDFDLLGDTKTNAIDDMKLLILNILVKKICKQKEDSYIFTNDDETEENHKLIDKWLLFILKVVPYANKTQIKGSSKKVRFVLNHLCKYLSMYSIKCDKCIEEENDKHVSIKSYYKITGLIDYKNK